MLALHFLEYNPKPVCRGHELYQKDMKVADWASLFPIRKNLIHPEKGRKNYTGEIKYDFMTEIFISSSTCAGGLKSYKVIT